MTTVIKSIGSAGGRDYSTLQSWEDALPADLTLTRSNTVGGLSSTSTIQLDAGASGTNNFYNNHSVTWNSQERLITAYNGTTKVATIGALNGGAATWSGTPNTSDPYVVNANPQTGQCYNDSEFTSAGNILTISGETTNSTNFITLTTGSGQSFIDNANVQTNALTYNQSNGVGIRITNTYAACVVSSVANTVIEKVQISATGTRSIGLNQTGGTAQTFRQMIIVSDGAGVNCAFATTITMQNLLLVRNTTNTADRAITGYGTNHVVDELTVVRPTNRTAAGTGIDLRYITYNVRNCVVFGYTTPVRLSGSGANPTVSYTATDQTAITGTGNIGSLTPSNEIEQPNATTGFDGRAKSGGSIINAGTTAGAAVDIVGTTRPKGTAYDMGCWELILFKPSWARAQGVIGDSAMYIKNTAGQHLSFALINVNTGQVLESATVTARRSIDGDTQALADNSVTELDNGQYNLELSAADTNGDEISFLFTATNAVPVEKTIVTAVSASGIVNGAPAPAHRTGRYYPSHVSVGTHTGFITTASRLYYIPYYIWEIREYAGFVMRNTSTNDSGEKCRMGLYSDSGGNPGTLIQAATEITFGGSASDNVTSNPFTPTYIGWHWICAHFDSASDVWECHANGKYSSDVGMISRGVNTNALFGTFNVIGDAYPNQNQISWYVDTAYGALASTAVAPTAHTSIAPWLGLIA